MITVTDFILNREGAQRELLQTLHDWLAGDLGLTPKIRYQIPFYYGRTWICYLSPRGPQDVELAFTRGNELSNEQDLLDFRDRKQIAGVVFSTADDIDWPALTELTQEAILLDETVAYTGPARKKP